MNNLYHFWVFTQRTQRQPIAVHLNTSLFPEMEIYHHLGCPTKDEQTTKHSAV